MEKAKNIGSAPYELAAQRAATVDTSITHQVNHDALLGLTVLSFLRIAMMYGRYAPAENNPEMRDNQVLVSTRISLVKLSGDEHRIAFIKSASIISH